MDYYRCINPFRVCAGLWVSGYLMVALVATFVAVSYYTVVVYAWGPLLLGRGVAAAVLAAFHLLIWDATRCKRIRTMESHRMRVGALAWNSSLLSSGSRDKSILHHDIHAQGRLC